VSDNAIQLVSMTLDILDNDNPDAHMLFSRITFEQVGAAHEVAAGVCQATGGTVFEFPAGVDQTLRNCETACVEAVKCRAYQYQRLQGICMLWQSVPEWHLLPHDKHVQNASCYRKELSATPLLVWEGEVVSYEITLAEEFTASRFSCAAGKHIVDATCDYHADREFSSTGLATTGLNAFMLAAGNTLGDLVCDANGRLRHQSNCSGVVQIIDSQLSGAETGLHCNGSYVEMEGCDGNISQLNQIIPIYVSVQVVAPVADDASSSNTSSAASSALMLDLSTQLLAFGRENWDQPQIVHAFAHNDFLKKDFRRELTIRHTMQNAQDSPNVTADILAVILDNDVPGVLLSKREIYVTESDCGSVAGPAECSSTTADYEIVLGSKPSQNVTVHLKVGGQLPRDGSQPQRAAESCLALSQNFPNLPSGQYWVDPLSTNAFKVSCDMVTDGGGWYALTLDASVDSVGGVIVAQASGDNPWHKCRDDVTKLYHGLNESSVPPVYSSGNSFTRELRYARTDGTAYTSDEVQAIRKSIDELSNASKMIVTVGDDTGAQVYVQDGRGGEHLLTPALAGSCGSSVGAALCNSAAVSSCGASEVHSLMDDACYTEVYMLSAAGWVSPACSWLHHADEEACDPVFCREACDAFAYCLESPDAACNNVSADCSERCRGCCRTGCTVSAACKAAVLDEITHSCASSVFYQWHHTDGGSLVEGNVQAEAAEPVVLAALPSQFLLPAAARFEVPSIGGGSSFGWSQRHILVRPTFRVISCAAYATGTCSTSGAGHCTFGPGNGVGGAEKLIGNATTREECAALVQESEPTANGATYSAAGSAKLGGRACYAEFGMTGVRQRPYITFAENGDGFCRGSSPSDTGIEGVNFISYAHIDGTHCMAKCDDHSGCVAIEFMLNGSRCAVWITEPQFTSETLDVRCMKRAPASDHPLWQNCHWQATYTQADLDAENAKPNSDISDGAWSCEALLGWKGPTVCTDSFLHHYFDWARNCPINCAKVNGAVLDQAADSADDSNCQPENSELYNYFTNLTTVVLTSQIVFEPETWNQPQTVSLQIGGNNIDQTVAGLSTYDLVVTHKIRSEDHNYADANIGVALADVVRVVVTENDVAGIKFTDDGTGPAGESSAQMQEGGTLCYDYELTSMPTSDVAVVIRPSKELVATPAVVLIPKFDAEQAAMCTTTTVEDVRSGLSATELIAGVHTVRAGAWSTLFEVMNATFSDANSCRRSSNQIVNAATVADAAPTTFVASVAPAIVLQPGDVEGLRSLTSLLADQLSLAPAQLQLVVADNRTTRWNDSQSQLLVIIWSCYLLSTRGPLGSTILLRAVDNDVVEGSSTVSVSHSFVTGSEISSPAYSCEDRELMIQIVDDDVAAVIISTSNLEVREPPGIVSETSELFPLEVAANFSAANTLCTAAGAELATLISSGDAESAASICEKLLGCYIGLTANVTVVDSHWTDPVGSSSSWSDDAMLQADSIQLKWSDGSEADMAQLSRIGVQPPENRSAENTLLHMSIGSSTSHNWGDGSAPFRPLCGIKLSFGAQYTITLQSMPTANVTVYIEPEGGILVTPHQVQFSESNWDIPVTVIVSGVDDYAPEPLETAFIQHSTDSLDRWYSTDAINVSSVNVSVVDNDAVRVQLSVESVLLSESGVDAPNTVTYSVTLAAQPVQNISVTIFSAPTAAYDISLSQSVLEFNPLQWNTPQFITIATADDGYDEGYIESFTLMHSLGGSALNMWNLSVMIIDDDVHPLPYGYTLVGSVAGPLAGETMVRLLPVLETATDDVRFRHFLESNGARVRCRFQTEFSSAAFVVEGYATTTNEKSVINCLTPQVQPDLHQRLLQTETSRIEVSVDEYGKEWVGASQLFTFFAPFDTETVSPLYGPEKGQTVVQFAVSTTFKPTQVFCLFGQTPAIAQNVSHSRELPVVYFSCLSPPRRFGSFFAAESELSVSLNGQQYVSIGTNFTYYDSRFATGPIAPASGPVGGGTGILIGVAEYYSLFTNGFICRFVSSDSDYPATPAIHLALGIVNGSHISCQSPVISQPAVYMLSVSVNGQQFFANESQFTYYAVPTGVTLDAKSVSSYSETTIRLTGSMSESDSIAVRFTPVTGGAPFTVRAGTPVRPGGRRAVQASDDVTVELTMPDLSSKTDMAHLLRGTDLSVAVSLNGYDFHNTESMLSMYNPTLPPRLFEIRPASGSKLGSSPVTVKGQNFAGTGGLACMFGSQKVPATFIGSSSMLCIAPTNIGSSGSPEAGLTPVVVTNGDLGYGKMISTDIINFRYTETSAADCIAVGPGISTPAVAGAISSFTILARTAQRQERITGSDVFYVDLISDSAESTIQQNTLIALVVDLDDQFYEEQYYDELWGQYGFGHIQDTIEQMMPQGGKYISLYTISTSGM
jgi:hypothetical protein